MNNKVSPVQFASRISSIDILRGVALFGILIVNVLGFNASFFSFGEYYQSLPDGAQRNFYNVFISLTADKFIFLFSFLFGYGMYMQFEKFKTAHAGFSKFFIRRMGVLFLFGITHVIFLWAGDVLILYALAGLIVLLIHKSSSWLVSAFAIVFYFFIGAWMIAEVHFSLPDAMSSTCPQCLDQALETYRQGNYLQCLQLRLYEYFSFRNINLFYYLPKIIGICLMGFLCSRYHLHQRIYDNRRKWAVILILIAVAATIVYFSHENIVNFENTYDMAIYMVTYEFMNLLVAFTYLLFILFVASFHGIAKFLKPMALMGRMSLTNYLMQSLVMAFIFYGWGLGLFGQTNVTFILRLALIIFIGQLVFNCVWFRFFRQGPLEKLWRQLSYGRK